MSKKIPMNVSVTSCVGWWRQLAEYLSGIDETNEERKEDLGIFVGYLKDMLKNKDVYC